MRKFLTIILILFSTLGISQVTTMVNDENNNLISSFFDEEAIVSVLFVDKMTHIEIDLNGGDKESDDIILRYEISRGPNIMWNNISFTYNIVFNIKSSGNNPAGGLIDIHSGSIMLFYRDGSSILYTGEGVSVSILE